VSDNSVEDDVMVDGVAADVVTEDSIPMEDGIPVEENITVSKKLVTLVCK